MPNAINRLPLSPTSLLLGQPTEADILQRLISEQRILVWLSGCGARTIHAEILTGGAVADALL